MNQEDEEGNGTDVFRGSWGDPQNPGCQSVVVGPRKPEEHSACAYLLNAMSITHGAFSFLFSACVTQVPVPTSHQS